MLQGVPILGFEHNYFETNYVYENIHYFENPR